MMETDSMRTHVTGLLATESTWRPLLAPFEVEGAFIAGDYAAVESVLALPDLPFSPEITFARVLNVLRVPDISASLKDKVLTQARSELGTEIAAAGQESYRRVYDAVLRLHILHELDLIHRKGRQHNSGSVTDLHQRLAERIESISPAFRNQELLLAMRRAAFRIR
jgi:serine/threonine-protein kinase ATR